MVLSILEISLELSIFVLHLIFQVFDLSILVSKLSLQLSDDIFVVLLLIINHLVGLGLEVLDSILEFLILLCLEIKQLLCEIFLKLLFDSGDFVIKVLGSMLQVSDDLISLPDLIFELSDLIFELVIDVP